MRKSTLLFAILWMPLALVAQTPNDAPKESCQLQVANGAGRFSWWARSGRTYFLQQSTSLSAPWKYVPIVEPGNDSLKCWDFNIDSESLFFRLQYSDIPSTDPQQADFDGDWIGNLAEVTQGTDPLLAADADANGIPDDWERTYAGRLTAWPPVLSAALFPQTNEAKTLILRNDTGADVAFTLTLENNAPAVYRSEINNSAICSWEEISTTGTLLALVSNSDDAFEHVAFDKFRFPFFGETHTSVFISSNGLLTFGAGSAAQNNTTLPSRTAPGALIAPFWADLDPSSAGEVFCREEADRFIIQYQNVSHYGRDGAYTFQVVLFSDGRIQLRYRSLTGSLHEPTAGIQNATGTLGFGIAAANITAQSVILIHPNSPFLTLPVTSGTVPAHSALRLDADFHAHALAPGVYTAKISTHHDASAGPNPLVGSATLEVLHPDPDGDGMPSSFEMAHGLDPARDDALEDNDGDRFPNIVEFSKGTLPEEPGSRPRADFTVSPGGTQKINAIIGALTQDWQIIEVLPGDYDQVVWLDSPHKVLLISRDGPFSTRLRSANPAYQWEVVGIYHPSVLDGFTITAAPGVSGQGVYVSAGPSRISNCVISGITASEPAARSAGGGAGIVVERGARLLLANCIVRDCFQAAGSPLLEANGSALLARNAAVEIENCTFVNSGFWRFKTAIQPALVCHGGSTSIRRSILWNPQSQQITAASGGSVSVENSVVRDGYPGNSAADPQLISGGHLSFRSPCRDAGGLPGRIRNDIDGQPRPSGKASDIGADEFADTAFNYDGDDFADIEESLYGTDPDAPDSNNDNDALPDCFELARFGNLDRTEKSSLDGDSLADAWEMVHLGTLDQGDADKDAMPDGWENANGLDPLLDDALQDHDGDRIPNLVEFLRGTHPGDSSSAPISDLIVGPIGSGAAHSSLGSALAEISADWQIIEVLPGTYDEAVRLYRGNVVLISRDGPFSTALRGINAGGWEVLGIHAQAVVDGFSITRPAGVSGPGIYVGPAPGSEPVRVGIRNCVISNCSSSPTGAPDGGGAIVAQQADVDLCNVVFRDNRASSGAALFASDSGLRINHCTFFGNTASLSGDALHASGSTVAIANSLLWNTGSLEISHANSSILVHYSSVRGGHPGTGNLALAPSLDTHGRLNFRSPGVNAAGPSSIRRDIDGDPRPWKGLPDMGADEMIDLAFDRDGDDISNQEELLHGSNPDVADVDSDSDRLADSNELLWFSNLERNATSDLNANSLSDAWELSHLGSLNNLSTDDPDQDGVPNSQEQASGCDPLDHFNGSIPYPVLYSDIIDETGLRTGFTKKPVDPADKSVIDFYSTAKLTFTTLDGSATGTWSRTLGQEPAIWNHLSGSDRFNPNWIGPFELHENPVPQVAGYTLRVLMSDPVPESVLTDQLNEFARKEFTGKYRRGGPAAWRDTNLRKSFCHYAKSLYAVVQSPSPNLAQFAKATWYIEDWKQDENEFLEDPPEIVWHQATLAPGVPLAQSLIPPDSESAEGHYRWGSIAYFQLHADLDRDGTITGHDAKLKWDGLEPFASHETKLAGTEILLAIPDNGQEPAGESAPSNDVKEIKPWSGFCWGEIRFQHPAISKLGFFRTRECRESDRITFPFSLENDNFRNFPNSLFVRVEKELPGIVKGDLVMEFVHGGVVRVKDELPLTLVPAEMVPDCNRDGVIDGKDRGQVTSKMPWRWWLNDDNDSGDLGGDDFPGSGRNGNDSCVNGVRDLVDFFPLYLDLKQLLTVLTAEDCEYRVVHEGASLQFVYTDLAIGDVRRHHHDQGPANELRNAQTNKIFANGFTRLTTSFLNKIKNEEGKGVLLVEAAIPASDKPLVLEVFKKGRKIAETKLSLRTSSVARMFRSLDLVPACGQSAGSRTNLTQPENLPDSYCNEKNFVFVHGYNVNPIEAQGWFSEMFKRLWHSGSRAKFTGVSWYGYESQGHSIFPASITPNYQANVLNAFGSAQALTNGLQSLQGPITIAGHSLGNMVIGSAIEDWGFSPTNYFMINAAVAKECYNEAEDQSDLMGTPFWEAYPSHMRSTEWHRLPWPETDWRSRLTWKNRLQAVSNLHNFYSSGEDVLQNPPYGEGIIPRGAAGIWAAQEKRKGLGLTGWILTSRYGGWAFGWHPDYRKTRYDQETEQFFTEPKTPEELQSDFGDLNSPAFFERLKFVPFFHTGLDALTQKLEPYAPSDIQSLFGPEGSSYASPERNRNRLLTEMIPARSTAAGSNPILGLPGTDMNAMKNSWPSERSRDPRWFHSDIRAVAYFFSYKVFDRFVTQGGLDQ